MKLRFFLPAIAVGLFLSTAFVSAEQIRLSNGKYLQGSFGEIVEDKGFYFKLTESGGKVFLRWSQVDESLKKRLLNKKDPTEDLNLEVLVVGSRLELLNGEIFEGDIKKSGNSYEVTNMEFERGKTVSAEEVIEDGFVEDIQIDAATVMPGVEVLALAEERRSPESARQFYELARIADRLALYEAARDYVSLALASSPESDLEAHLTEYQTKLEELIRQRQILQEIVNAKALTKKKKFQLALDLMDQAKTDHNPTDIVLDKWQEIYDEIDLDFTKFVIKDYYKRMKPAAREYLKKKREIDLTVQEALNWARRQMDVEIQTLIADTVGSEDVKDIKKRFSTRFDLETEKIVRLSTRKESFSKTGFYQIVGGNLPIAGKKPAPKKEANKNNDTGRRFPRRRDRDGIGDAQDADQGFQGVPELPEGISPDDIRDILEKLGKGSKGSEKGKNGKAPKIGKQDISKLKIPSSVPPLANWWAKASKTTRASWLMAVYVRYGNTMRVIKLDDWNVKYK
ncbi:MAG: tetratricopeptide repeat protein [Planctomycetes bacterium]|nr:tetratricopeptide repeat protein [Planctomycetota bacterium]